MDLKREQDVEELRRVAIALESANRHLIEALERKCKELEALKGSEGELQMTLALIDKLTKRAQGDDAPAAKRKAPRAKRKNGKAKGPTPQPLLPIEVEVYELDEPDTMCPSCGGTLEPLDGQYESSEMIDVVEVRYVLKQVQRQKYVCRCGGCVETAPGPQRTMPGGRYSLAFAAKVAIDKYLDHIPLTRQVRIMARHGLDVGSQTLWDQLHALSERLAPIDDALMAKVLAEPVIGLDQTGWKRLGAGNKAKPWQIWCLTAPGLVVHRIRDDKSAHTFRQLVGTYSGVIVCDALKTHEAGARDGPGIVLANCWAHAFRRFEEALPDHPEAERAMTAIRALYDIDARAEDDPDALASLRSTESAAVLAELKDWLWDQATLKSLSIGKAAAYTIANWDRLTRFVDDPRIPLDNNATERAIRGPVVGRKNHYGSKSRRGTVVAARLYSILETAKLCGVDPAAYLHHALRALDLGELILPADFANQ